jgi:hypothetical protein
MRSPSTEADLYDWHARSLRGERVPVHDGEPHCGWFRRRLVRGGPWVPARIWLEQDVDPETGELAGDEVFRCEVDGERRSATGQWTWLASNPISRDAYEALLRARDTDPAMAASMVRLDLSSRPTRP